ncbi:MAG: flagellar M-ring protein FliF [Candidatus Fermentithermobacillus carboniphilus]|uniref:Flagellar M-ring protein n=1 Tax=Candidatus Fermentithermobacillus carboniphilus TaxID=3085328 RepID=A0AAT9LFJ3_9FIRM|nr:MAG: flagellar M-ring protein FliF [Candidatus Fermentithermobacillus carboniphilus]
MGGSFSSLVKGLSETWHKLGRVPRLVVGAGALTAFLALAIMTFLASRGPAYDVLWSNLDPADGGAIVDALEKRGIPYQLTDGGRTIKVPADQVYRVRLSLAAEGLPSSGIVGFESITSKGVWATDFERRVQYVRALSGELTRTIKSISGVEDARVHIVLPEPSVFVSQAKPATAAVLVKMRPMQELSPASVRGIVNLVSRSVEGLSPENVTVIDASGKLLSQDVASGTPDEPGSAGNLVFELTTKTERELEKRLLDLLSPVLGPGNVVCQVRAELNMDKVKITDTTYTSEPPGILRSSAETVETYQGSGTVPGGQAGGLNVPSYASPGSGESQYQRTETTRNYEVNQKVTETIITPGTIKKLSVAVVVNKELDEGEKDIIRETVSAALGLDPARQDQISVTGMLFDTSLAEKIQEAMKPAPQTFPRIYVYAIAAAGALLLGTLLFILLRRRRKVEEPVREEPVPAAASAEEAPAISPELLARQKNRENVERLARTNPKVVATLIKSWLLEDER